jgi:hypothetical protein
MSGGSGPDRLRLQAVLFHLWGDSEKFGQRWKGEGMLIRENKMQTHFSPESKCLSFAVKTNLCSKEA